MPRSPLIRDFFFYFSDNFHLPARSIVSSSCFPKCLLFYDVCLVFCSLEMLGIKISWLTGVDVSSVD